MATSAELLELGSLVPWDRDDFRRGLQSLTDSTSEAARRFAADMRVLADLSRRVPRCAHDERGATPWTSFRREVAVARRLSDQGAAAEIRAARLLIDVLPHTMALLEAGAVTVQRARAFVNEVEMYEDELAAALDEELAERVAGFPPWRITQEVRRTAARLDAEAAALRTASKNAGRSVSFLPLEDDQAEVAVRGPAVPLTRWYATLDAQARALKQAGDPRTLDSLRFDLATSTFPCTTHLPSDPRADVAGGGGVHPAPAAAGRTGEDDLVPAGEPAWPVPTGPVEAEPSGAVAGLSPSFVEPASTDCRLRRPVQANITIPVETSLGLSNEPAWLDGYGWISAPAARLLLVDGELRRVCLQNGTGQLVDRAERDVRPPPTPAGVRGSLLEMVLHPIELRPVGFQHEEQHDPSSPLQEYVALRDRFCDGPTGSRSTAARCDLDHEIAHPEGPTAAWNLVARARRTHQLKHYGWLPLRTPTSTLWISPAGQIVEVARHEQRPPGIDPAPATGTARLPDADGLAALDEAQLRPRDEQDVRPWVPASEREQTSWTWLEDAPPF